MQRCFFDFEDSSIVRHDTIGSDLPDENAGQGEATAFMAEMVRRSFGKWTNDGRELRLGWP